MLSKTIKKPRYSLRRYRVCPFCEGAIFLKHQGIEDRLYTTKKTFSVYECEDCGAAHLNPMPIGDVGQFYPINYLSGEEEIVLEGTKGPSFDLEKWYRYNQYRFDFQLLRNATGIPLRDVGSYIDIGCGSGERVTFARNQGCKGSRGIDKFDFAKNAPKKEAAIINSEVLKFRPKEKFQVASMFHVLEHVDNPREMLVHIRKHILDKEGVIVVQVPNYGSFERRIFGSKWFGFDVPRHIWQYNERALVEMLEKAEYKVERTYKLNATLHPVTTVPSLFRDLDVQRIWVGRSHGQTYKKVMTMLWAVLTVAVIPVNIIQNIFRQGSMLTVVASKNR